MTKQILDSLKGHEFEEFVADIFIRLGYDKVRLSKKTADFGRDILMELNKSGEKIDICVECKHHKGSVGRPIVQKLHSAVMTYSKRKREGILVISGKFSKEAMNYAKIVNKKENMIKLRLINGRELKELAKKVGLDISCSTIEIISKKCFPYSPIEGAKEIIKYYFDDIKFINKTLINIAKLELNFKPCFYLNYQIDKDFKTRVGIIYSIHKEDFILLNGRTGKEVEYPITEVVIKGIDKIENIPVNKIVKKEDYNFDGKQLREMAVDLICRKHGKTVHYMGRNKRWYSKYCQPSSRDVYILNSKTPYMPLWVSKVKLIKNEYKISFIEGLKNVCTQNDETSLCKICKSIIQNKWFFKSRWFCKECGAITCYNDKNICKWCRNPVCKYCTISKKYGKIFKKKFCNKVCLKEYDKKYQKASRFKKIQLFLSRNPKEVKI